MESLGPIWARSLDFALQGCKFVLGLRNLWQETPVLPDNTSGFSSLVSLDVLDFKALEGIFRFLFPTKPLLQLQPRLLAGNIWPWVKKSPTLSEHPNPH